MDLYKKIDALSKAEDWQEAVEKIQEILKRMAYYASQSEGAILETHEEWRGAYSNQLHRDAGKRLDQEAVERTKAGKGGEERLPGAWPHPKPKGKKKANDDLPPSLRALMKTSSRFDDSDSD